MFVIQTKLTPPRSHKRILHRPRLTGRLLEALDHRVTLVHAEAGYGKSTALAALAEGRPEFKLAWYHLDAEDAEPLVFMAYLVHSLRTALPQITAAPQVALEAWEKTGEAGWPAVVDLLANELARLGEPVLLVLDDAHYLAQSPPCLQALDRLVNRVPFEVHVVLAARQSIPLPSLPAWRLRGDLLEITRDELAFTPDEVAALFTEHYGAVLTGEQAHRLAADTEGWAIALLLAWHRSLPQDQRDGSASAVLPATPAIGATSRSMRRDPQNAASPTAQDLFDYLAYEVLAQQPPELVSFLRQTAVLRELSPAICDCLLSTAAQPGSVTDSTAILRHLFDNGLFVVHLGNGHARYHYLFQGFLLQQLSPEEACAAHRRAAACYGQHDSREEALHHLLAGQAWEDAAVTLCSLGQGLVRAGRLDTLAGWIHALPPDVLDRHPPLMSYLGDVARLHSRFGEALGWYRQAETRSRALGDLQAVGQALRGQARIYLDTVNPSQAEHLLQEALRLSDGQEDRETRIRLLELMAENRLNLGKLEDAERLQTQAQALRAEVSTEAELAVRVLIRTGRLAEARAILEQHATAEQQAPVLRPRAHRETLLLLSLILAFEGEGEVAYRCALEGTARGEALGSPFITAVGAMRQGHAWHLRDGAVANTQAMRCFGEAIDLANSLAVPRLKVEAHWGLCRAYGLLGDIAAAEETAAQGMAIAQQTGDEWITGLIRLALAASYVQARRYDDSLGLLDEAAATFRDCGDVFGDTAARLWQCLVWQATGDDVRLKRGLDDLLRSARDHGYDFLFIQRSLLGPSDARQIVPLLLLARASNCQRTYAESLLARMGLSKLELHPGYQLRVQTLGPLRVWRGLQEVAPQEWRRDKARQLFLLLLTQRGQLLERDQIVEMLWPGLDSETAERDFKVALSTLVRVLEPNLPARAASAFVLREGTLYGLRPEADLWLDAAEFERLVSRGVGSVQQPALLAGSPAGRYGEQPPGTRHQDLDSYRQALALYRGDYLHEYPYEEWCIEARERLLDLYLRTADRLATALAERGEWQETIEVSQAILQRDDCWEQAYRLMMLAYARLGNRPQVLRTYKRCTERLQQALHVEPTPATVALFRSLLNDNAGI